MYIGGGLGLGLLVKSEQRTMLLIALVFLHAYMQVANYIPR
jgi:hypothetical protein